MTELWHTIEVVLERGGPYEIQPGDMPHMKAQAERYLKADHPQEAKDRVAAVWIAGEQRGAWMKFTPMPDLRDQLKAFKSRATQTTTTEDAGYAPSEEGGLFG